MFFNRPTLVYHRAFDLCAMMTDSEDKSVPLFTSSLFYARELTKRLSAEVLLYPTSQSRFTAQEIRAAMGPEIAWQRVHYDSIQPPNLPLNALIWAEPEAQSWPDTLNEIHQLARPSSKLCILGTTKLRRILPEWATYQPAHQPLDSPRPLIKAMRQLGYVIEDLYGLHGPLSLLFGSASRIPALLGREEWVDRCHIAMRQRFVVRGWQATLAPIWLLVARNEQGATDV